jgi:hypothetical protein
VAIIDDTNFQQFRKNLSLVLSGFRLTREQAEILKNVITLHTDIRDECPCSECHPIPKLKIESDLQGGLQSGSVTQVEGTLDAFGNCTTCGGGIEGSIEHMPDCPIPKLKA